VEQVRLNVKDQSLIELADKGQTDVFDTKAAGDDYVDRGANSNVGVDEKGRSNISDIDRSLYDFVMSEEGYERYADGLTPEIVTSISRKKDEPAWMLQLRLEALETYHELKMADNWGPDCSGLDLNHISTYVSPRTKQARSWDDVPKDIKQTFERLGIPDAERKSLAGVGAQYDSEIVYHNMRDDVAKQGVVYTTIEDALHDPRWEPMVKKYFSKLIPLKDHKFAALHYAVWSGGSFVYVPKGVTLSYPLQSYFRLNASSAGQFEHTLIIVDDEADLHFIEGCSAPKYYEANLHAGAVELFVGNNARMRYSTIENWSKNMYNLNTKRALVGENSRMEWISGSFGSHVSYLYPSTILQGNHSTCEFTGITFAGATQNLDTGCKIVMNGQGCKASVDTKSISKDGGINTFRSSMIVGKSAHHSVATVSCQSLMLDDISRSDTIPANNVRCATASVGHEATIGRISDDTILYLMSRGCSEAEARTMVVNGFASPVSKELPLEYAVEMNNLIKIEMEGAIG
jgi:feS assembly protein sufB